MTIAEGKARFDDDYIDMLEMYKELRKQRGIKRKTVADKIGMNYRTYYKKETYGLAASVSDMRKFLKAIGFDLSITSSSVFSMTKRQKEIKFND